MWLVPGPVSPAPGVTMAENPAVGHDHVRVARPDARTVDEASPCNKDGGHSGDGNDAVAPEQSSSHTGPFYERGGNPWHVDELWTRPGHPMLGASTRWTGLGHHGCAGGRLGDMMVVCRSRVRPAGGGAASQT